MHREQNRHDGIIDRDDDDGQCSEWHPLHRHEREKIQCRQEYAYDKKTVVRGYALLMPRETAHYEQQHHHERKHDDHTEVTGEVSAPKEREHAAGDDKHEYLFYPIAV